MLWGEMCGFIVQFFVCVNIMNFSEKSEFESLKCQYN